MDARKPQPGPVIRSKVNKGKSQDEIVRNMDRKLAGGANLVFKKELEDKSRKASVVLFYAGLYFVLLVMVLASLGWIKTRKPTPVERAPKYVQVTDNLESAHQDYEITSDEYARYLMYLLVRYDELPERFKAGVPRFSRQEVLGKLRTAWPDLADNTRNLIFRHLPEFYQEMHRKESQEASL